MRGLELQADVDLASDWHGLARYASLDNRNANPITERTQYSRHSGSVGLAHKFGYGWSWSAMYQGASLSGIDQSRDGREELTLSKAFKLVGSDATSSLLLRRLDNKTTTAYLDTDSSTSSSYNNRLQIFGHFRISFLTAKSVASPVITRSSKPAARAGAHAKAAPTPRRSAGGAPSVLAWRWKRRPGRSSLLVEDGVPLRVVRAGPKRRDDTAGRYEPPLEPAPRDATTRGFRIGAIRPSRNTVARRLQSSGR